MVATAEIPKKRWSLWLKFLKMWSLWLKFLNQVVALAEIIIPKKKVVIIISRLNPGGSSPGKFWKSVSRKEHDRLKALTGLSVNLRFVVKQYNSLSDTPQKNSGNVIVRNHKKKKNLPYCKTLDPSYRDTVTHTR